MAMGEKRALMGKKEGGGDHGRRKRRATRREKTDRLVALELFLFYFFSMYLGNEVGSAVDRPLM